jgi:hypothetical protein
MSPGGVDEYPEVEVKFIPGHNPDLVVDGQRIDLTKYKTHVALHELFDKHGFRRTAEPPASPDKSPDKSTFCTLWADRGECTKNSQFMKTTCPATCLKFEL